jgi:hypothetical protein
MAVSRNKDLINNLTDADKNSYIKLRQSLDSFNDVALAEFDLSLSRADRKEISEFVAGKVRELISEIGILRGKLWSVVNSARAEEFALHSCKILGAEELAKHSTKLLEAEEFRKQEAEERSRKLKEIIETGKGLAEAEKELTEAEKKETKTEKELTEAEKERAALAAQLSIPNVGNCPPGFEEVDGICVPI